MRWIVPLLCALSVFGPEPAGALAEISIYGMAVQASPSQVSGTDPGGLGTFSFSSDWIADGTAGMRVTWWGEQDVGWGLDVQYSGVAADAATLAGAGANALALEDGLGLVTLNAYRRWSGTNLGLTPYVGAGLGLAVPSVNFDGGGSTTSGRQLTGPAVRIVAGAQYPISDRMALFGEYQGSYSINQVELSGGGSLDTEILTNGLNFGLSLGF